MVENIITFSANQQKLTKTGGISKYASDTVSYITATFDLGNNWTGFDEVRAVFKTPFDCRTAVLNSLGECEVPREILCYKAIVRVNLVGSVYTEESVVDRLTTYSCEALEITEDVPVGGNESAPLSPSEYEQFVANVAEDANRAEAGATSAEASAQSAGESAESAEQSADDALRYSQNSEASAIRSSGSSQSASQSATSAQSYAQNASESATEAETAKDEAEDARDEIRAMRATATTLAEGSDATASYSNGVLSLGIPKGDTGARGQKGDTGSPAGFGTVSATVDDQIGTPSVEVTTSGADTAKNFDFSFHNLKGEKGDKGDTGEVSYADLSALLPTDTASGAIASFPDGQSVIPAVSVLAQIEPIQDLHGYDKPWSGGAGKNKIDFTVKSHNGIITTKTDGKAIISGTATATAYPVDFVLTELPAGTYVWSVSGITSGATAAWTKNGAWAGTITQGASITLTETATIGGYVSVTNGTTVNTTVAVQLESGSMASAWTPYSNICPISGHTECVTSVSGFNVWDEEWEAGYISTNTGEKFDSTTNIRSKNFISVPPNTTYYCTRNTTASSSNFTLLFYDESKNFLGSNTVQYKTNATFTTPQNARFMRFYMAAGYGTTYNHDISINYPSTDTDYHAYQGTTHTTTLGRTVYGGSLDVVSGVLTVTHGIVDMGDISSYSEDPNRAGVFYFGMSGRAPSSNVKSCSVYEVDNVSVTTSKDGYISGAPSYGGGACFLRDTSKAGYTSEQMKTALTGQTLVYELNEPQTYQLTPTEVELLQGQNNVWCDTGNIEVTYKADVGLYIDKKLG